MGGMWLWWILGIAIVGIAAWAIVRPLSRSAGKESESPEEALKRRYARGEIDKDDYEKRLRTLRE